MTTLKFAAVVAVAATFAASAVLKLGSPDSVSGLVNAFPWLRLTTRWIAVVVAGTELVVAVGVIAGFRPAFFGAVALVGAFSAAIAAAIRRGAHPRCGCLGDLSVTRVSATHLVRNAILLGLVALAILAPNQRPVRAVPAGLVLAFLVLLVPEAFETLRQFRRDVRDEFALVLERRDQIA